MMINIEMINSYNANAFHLISRLLEKIITENYRPTILKSYFIKKKLHEQQTRYTTTSL